MTADMTLYAKWETPSTGGDYTAPTSAPVKQPAAAAEPFTDVKSDAWCYAAVHYAVDHGLFYGTGEKTFSPDGEMTRGMLAAVLYRMTDEPKPAAGSLFSDVEDGKYYTEAIAWAAENEIVTGYGNDRFGPEDPITREQLAVMLWRYAGSPESAGDLTGFTDEASISVWAVPALRWAVENKIVSGKGSGILDPSGKATRAEVAAMLMRYCETF